MKMVFKKLINFDTRDPKIINRSKNIVALGSISIFGFLVLFVVLVSNKNKIKIDGHKLEKIDIASSIITNPEDEWLNKAENDLNLLREENKRLLDRLVLLEEQNKETNDFYKETINDLNTKIIDLAAQKTSKTNEIADAEPGERYNEYGELMEEGIATISIDLENNVSEDIGSKDLENYIPAGSYAKARMLSGADVSTGVNNQSDPNNMMFEIISPVYAPKYHGYTQEIKKIEGCRVTGAAIGQLWTEKAYIRLLKMICSFNRGRVVEFNVKGYVTSFAKEGVRGRIVSREGHFTSMAFLAGAIEGLADVTKMVYSPKLEVTSGLATQKTDSKHAARQAGAGGLGKAAEILSKYYIDRAEQYQSVIDVPSGIVVEIVFQEGVDLNTKTSFKVKTSEADKLHKNTNLINSYTKNHEVF